MMRATVPTLVMVLAAVLLLPGQADAQAKWSRQGGLQASQSSSTAGEGNLHLTVHGRSFLWDNQAAQKVPPLLPHVELNFGATDYLDVTAGINVLSYLPQPGSLYLRVKATTPDNKSIRLLGFAQTAEIRRSLLKFFPSNGFRVGTEGFGPEGFIFGNGEPVTSYRLMTSVDIELIRISSWLPFKLYANAGWEGEFASLINEDNAAISREEKRIIPDQDFSKMPMALGFELKTWSSDFFAEVEAEPFAGHVLKKFRAELGRGEDGDWRRFQVVG
ncbi:MAG TPA: hypothetical protein VK465_14615, partial [Fibrobacteria bacterium]|nr:hypothetical protein [Fibrobacteria bacterium]